MRRRLWLLLPAAAFALGAGTPVPSGLEIVKLPAGSAHVRIGEELVLLGPGSPAQTLPLEQPIAVVGGGIWVGFGDLTLRAWPGDAFRFRRTGDGVELHVASGKLVLVRPDGSTRQLDAGQFFSVAPPAAPASPPPAAPGGCGAPVRRGDS